jgi:regulator of RNase E activity RraA
VVPSGPHKGFGGTIDGAIACAGCPVAPGDIVLGDDDGIAVVPLAGQADLLAVCQDKLEQERGWLAAIEAGQTMAELLDLPKPEMI